MAYIESFLLYVVVVLSVFLIPFIFFLFFYMLYGQFRLSYEHGTVTGEMNKEYFYKLLKNRYFKFIVLAYFATFTFFYINKATDYFGENRDYPQAKAYKIVADLVLFDYDFLIANRDLYYKPSGLKYINAYQKIQNYLMQKGFEYIPKDDAERAIWKYEYFYSQYIRAMAAPIDFKKLHKSDLGYILRIGGHPTVYKPKAKEMLIEVESLLDSLMTNPMKDKYYDEVNRYTTTILFSEWWEKFSFLHYTLGVRTPHEALSKDYTKLEYQWTDDKEYLERLNKLSNWLDITKDKIDNSKQLQKEMKRHKLLYPDLMGLRVKFMSNLTYANMQHNEISCKNKMLQKYFIYKTEFLKFSNSNYDYINLKGKQRWFQRSLVNSGTLDYVLFKYCNIKKNKLEFERSILTNWNMDSNGISNKTKKILEGFKDAR